MAFGLNINKLLAPAFIILGAIVGLLILAGFMGPYFDAVGSITENFTDGETGNAAADSILQVFAFVVPVVLVLGLVGLIITVAVIEYKRS